MPYDYGLVGGIGQGIQQGLLTYMKAKQLNRENQIQNLTAGIETDENGNLKLNPQMQAQKDAQYAQSQGILASQDPHSQRSVAARGLLKSQLEAVRPGSGDSVSDDLSETQIKELGIPLAKPEISGYYGLQKAQLGADTSRSNAQLGADTKEKVAKIGAGAKIGAAQIAGQTQGKRLGLMEERIHNQNLDKINKDPMASQLITTTNNLQNAISNFQQGGATPQEFQELQQAVRSNLGIKGTSGVDERSETYLNSLGIKKDKMLQFLTGDPKSVIESDPQFANQIVKIANLEMANKKKQYQAQVDKLAAGHKSFYSAHPDLKADYDSTFQGGQSQMGLLGQPSQQPQGSVGSQDQKIADYAKQNGLDYQHAQEILIKRGYKPNGQ